MRSERQALVTSLRSRLRHDPARSDVRKVACPYCGSRANEHCVGRRDKIRESNHVERIEKYLTNLRGQRL